MVLATSILHRIVSPEEELCALARENPAQPQQTVGRESQFESMFPSSPSMSSSYSREHSFRCLHKVARFSCARMDRAGGGASRTPTDDVQDAFPAVFFGGRSLD